MMTRAEKSKHGENEWPDDQTDIGIYEGMADPRSEKLPIKMPKIKMWAGSLDISNLVG